MTETFFIFFWVEMKIVLWPYKARDGSLQIKPVCRGCFYHSALATEAKAVDSLFIDLNFEYRKALKPSGKVLLCFGLVKVESLEKSKKYRIILQVI